MWLERNLEVLTKRNPRLAARVSSATSSDVKLISLGDQNFDLSDASGLVYGGNPPSSVDRFWAQQNLHNPLKNPLLLGFYGFDLGFHFRRYRKNPHPRNRSIFVVEKSPAVFRMALEIQDWREELQDPKVEWIIGENISNLRALFYDYFQDALRICYTGSIENVHWLPALKRDGPYYVEVARALAAGNETLVNSIRGAPEDNFRGLFNVLDNIPLLSQEPSFDGLRDVFRNRPGIVVATGPSLNAALPAIKKAQGSTVIFAVDSVVPLLLKEGITPHFVACLERVTLTKKLFAGLPDLPDTWLTFLPVVFPETIASYPGPRTCMLPRGLSLDWLIHDRLLHRAGPSSATMAFTGLDWMGCDPIILMGQDLAFDRQSERSHAVGAHSFLQEFGASMREEMKQDETRASENWVNGNNGELILSWEPYRLIAHYYEDLISRSDKKCINAILPEYGMLIQGAQRMNPEEAVASFCRENFSATKLIRDHLKSPSSVEYDRNSQELKNCLNETHQSLERIRNRSLKILEDMSLFYHRNLPSLVTKEMESAYNQKCQLIEEEVNALVRDEKAFVSSVWSFVTMTHVRILMKYYELQGSEGNFRERLEPMFHLWEEWFREVFFWSARIEALLRRFL